MITLATDIFDLRGPQFLLLYGVLLVLSLGVGLIVCMVGRRLDPPPIEVENDGIGPYDAAYLAGGRARLTEAAVASLYQGGFVRVSGRTALKSVLSLPDDAPQVERDVYAVAQSRGQLKDVIDATRGAGNVIRHRLIEQRLLLPLPRRMLIRLISGAAFLPVLVMGIVKICVGLGRDKPVLFLLLLCLLTVVLMFTLALHLRTSWAGGAVLRSLRFNSRGLDHRTRIGEGAEQAAWECALFGAAVVATGELAEMGRFLSPPSSAGSGGAGCSDSGCGSGCGGGCGGCGGD